MKERKGNTGAEYRLVHATQYIYTLVGASKRKREVKVNPTIDIVFWSLP
jgi:hypothetical protein